MIGEIVARVVEGEDLDAPSMERAMDAILSGQATEAQIAGLAVALRMKGETAVEIAAAARAMRARCDRVDLGGGDAPLLDTCGTGGDGAGTFNVSTVSAIVVAAAGVRVAKHGNRAISSRAGSADVLEALGVPVQAPFEVVKRSVDEVGIGFLFAPAHHGALRHAAPVRRALGIRTFFNLLGPLSSPAGATHQLVGIYDPRRVAQIAEVLGMLGLGAAWVVHGDGGLDEIATSGPTTVARLAKGRVTVDEIGPRDFGIEPSPADGLRGGDAAHNAAIARAVLAGERGTPRDAVVINAGAALCVAGVAGDPREGAERAAAAIDSGRARATLERWIAITKTT